MLDVPADAPDMTTINAEVEAVKGRLFATALRHGGDPAAAAADPHLLSLWTAVEPETRGLLLLAAAQGDRPVPTSEDSAGYYAASLRTYAHENPGEWQEFIGPHYTRLPVTGPAGALASSLAFDREEHATSLRVLLLLALSDPR